MVSLRCKAMVEEELQKMGLPHVVVDLGAVALLADITPKQHETLRKNLLKNQLRIA